MPQWSKLAGQCRGRLVETGSGVSMSSNKLTHAANQCMRAPSGCHADLPHDRPPHHGVLAACPAVIDGPACCSGATSMLVGKQSVTHR